MVSGVSLGFCKWRSREIEMGRPIWHTWWLKWKIGGLNAGFFRGGESRNSDILTLTLWPQRIQGGEWGGGMDIGQILQERKPFAFLLKDITLNLKLSLLCYVNCLFLVPSRNTSMFLVYEILFCDKKSVVNFHNYNELFSLC